MALNDSEVMRVHKDFKKYISDTKKKTGIPGVKITERIANLKPLVPFKKVK